MDQKTVENELLSIYRRVSPSIINLDSEEDITKFFKRRLSILKTLGLPTQLFQNKKLLDIGGGTGEKTLIYALLGADVTIVEPNEKSCQYAKKLFANFIPDSEPVIINKSLFEFDTSLIKNFDIVVCEGVLMITHDQILAMDRIISNLKDQAIVLLALCEPHSWFKRNLQRKLIHKLAGDNEDEIVKISKKYFQKHLDRAVKIGLRPEKTVIYDSYVIADASCSPLQEICNSFKDNKISYLSSFPTLDLFYQTESWSSPISDPFDYEFYKGYYKFLEKVWMTSGEENLKKDVSEFEFIKIKKRVEEDYQQLIKLEKRIDDGTFNDNDLKPIQNGYLGIGMNYFVGIKQSNDMISKLKR